MKDHWSIMRYHVNRKTGNVGQCRALISCPLGDLEQDHYATEIEARQAYETMQGPLTMASFTKNGVAIKELNARQQAEVETMNEKEHRFYVTHRRNGLSHTQAMKHVEEERDSFRTGFQNSSLARKKAKRLLSGEPAVKPLDTPHDKAEDRRTREGITYSAVTRQQDGRIVQTIQGREIVMHVSSRAYRVEHGENVLGFIERNERGKWTVVYPNSQSGRAQPSGPDAINLLMKKFYPEPRITVATPKPGHNPAVSEIDPHSSFRNNNDRTVGRLRRLCTRDLVYEYNRLSLSKASAHYTAEQLSDEAALRRVEKVLNERGETLMAKYSPLRQGQDFSDAPTYTLASKREAS